MVSPPDDDGDYVEYHFWVDKDDWDNWKRTVDRDTSLDTRIRELLAVDTRAEGNQLEQALSDTDAFDLDEEETLNLLRLKLGRCNARANSAAAKIRNDNPDAALVTVDKIAELTQPFARET